ncbi:Electron transport complex subunit RsxB [Saezia sanguinis]|uniref:Electron transport complex subunit RsxB n=2 Tax=Saezia sanguinis TaxID=1965230 RepID=A0A433SGV1_9BURK|nr:Electron transport complex subunit RsxB [Saezia sanguinis]
MIQVTGSQEMPSAYAKMTPMQRQKQVELIDAQLPQTQCTRCGYPDCRHYAQAIAEGRTGINRCPPGGAQGIARLAEVTQQTVQKLDPDAGTEGPRLLAVIDENWCIGCTKCIQACPVDCIMGASKQMHTVIEDLCTGCELCLPACPVDCIELVPSSCDNPTPTGWAAWSKRQADTARERYVFRQFRLERRQRENQARLLAEAQRKLANLEQVSKLSDPHTLERKRELISQVLAKAKARQAK